MTDILIRNATLIDGTDAEPVEKTSLLVRRGRIREIGQRIKTPKRNVKVIRADGLTLMPGLTDAHVHFAMIGPTGSHGDDPWVAHVLIVKETLARALQEGFTTVRDAGGLEPAYARAVEAGRIDGPRILPSGGVLSQTGGHGDLRAHHEDVHRATSIAGLIAGQAIVDGVDAVRWAAREQLRRGATQIKMFASGGVLSPTAPFDSLQFTVEEIAAAVGVARDWHTYVMAHTHTAEAMGRCLDAGVRSLEHGILTDKATAKRVAQEGAFITPTLLVLEQVLREVDAGESHIGQAEIDKLRWVQPFIRDGIANMAAAGVKISSGSDIVGPEQSGRAGELILKAAHLGNREALRSATVVNAELFGMSDRIGTLDVGKDADLLLVDGDPLKDISVLTNPDRLRLVMRGGVAKRDLDGRLAA